MKGICFKESLFHATIEGRKTQTRRLMEPQPDYVNERNEPLLTCATFPYACQPTLIKPRYKVGDVGYLKEPYATSHGRDCEGVIYRFDDQPGSTDFWDKDTRWKNKLFMPESAARYFIKITAVRAERLRDISDSDCVKEGLVFHKDPFGMTAEEMSITYGNFLYRIPREAYAALIDKINGKGTWDSNPWVWVYDYELCESVNSKE